MYMNNIQTLEHPTMNGLKSLTLDDLTTDNIVASTLSANNMDGDYFSIDTIESNNVLVDAELHLTNTGFIIVGKGTETEAIITDDDIKLLDGLTSNVQEQINNINNDNSGIVSNIETLELNTQHITSDATNTYFSSNIQSNKLIMNGLHQNRAFTDTIYSQHNSTQVNTQYISSDGQNNTFLKDIVVNDVMEFSNKSNVYIVEEDSYGLIGKVNSGTKNFYIQSDSTLNNDIILESFGGETIVKKNLKLESALEINGEIQNKAYTDIKEVVLLSTHADLQLLEISVGENIQAIDNNSNILTIWILEVEDHATRLTALETGSTKIFSQNNIGWNSVNATASPWQDGTINYIWTEKYDMGNINHTLFNSITGRWQMGTCRVLIDIQASFSLPYCSVKLLQSLIRVENSSNALTHGSYSQGINRTSYTTHLSKVNYNAMLVVTLNDGDKVYISTDYDIITGGNGTYTCNFNVQFNEM